VTKNIKFYYWYFSANLQPLSVWQPCWTY